MTEGWPWRMKCGRIEIVAHAPWCPVELARQVIAKGDNALGVLGVSLRETCRCAVAPPVPRSEVETR